MISKTSVSCLTHSAWIVPAAIKLFNTAAIPPINPAPTKAGIRGIKIFEITLAKRVKALGGCGIWL